MDKIAIKAGMGNIDRARVEAIIYRMTRNSPMAQKERRDEDKHRVKTRQIRQLIESSSGEAENLFQYFPTIDFQSKVKTYLSELEINCVIWPYLDS